MKILHSKNANGGLNRPPQILRSKNGKFPECHGKSDVPRFPGAKSGNSALNSKFHAKFVERGIQEGLTYIYIYILMRWFDGILVCHCSSCTDCTSSPFPCAWCVADGECIAADSSCRDPSPVVNGDNANVSFTYHINHWCQVWNLSVNIESFPRLASRIINSIPSRSFCWYL